MDLQTPTNSQPNLYRRINKSLEFATWQSPEYMQQLSSAVEVRVSINIDSRLKTKYVLIWKSVTNN